MRVELKRGVLGSVTEAWRDMVAVLCVWIVVLGGGDSLWEDIRKGTMRARGCNCVLGVWRGPFIDNEAVRDYVREERESGQVSGGRGQNEWMVGY
jgi:hypothetical protein